MKFNLSTHVDYHLLLYSKWARSCLDQLLSKKKNDRKCLFHYRNSSFICTCNVLKIIFTWDGKANQNKRYGKFHFPYDLAFHLQLLPKKTYIGFYQLFIQNSTWTNTNYYLNIRRTSNKNTLFIKITFWKHVPNEINLRHSYHFNNFLSFDWPTSAKVTRIFRYFFRKERAINVCNWNKSPKSSIEILRLSFIFVHFHMNEYYTGIGHLARTRNCPKNYPAGK